jgi:hypothetical protein
MTEKRRGRARRMSKEILDRAEDARDPVPETPLGDASKASTPPRPGSPRPEATEAEGEDDRGRSGR